MRSIPNTRLTTDFSLYEFIEAQLPPRGVALNWKNIRKMDMEKIHMAAQHAQSIRDLINKEFKNDLYARPIGLTITSGWRCREWELLRGRSGDSQHTIAAYDAIPSNCSLRMAVSIIGWIKHHFEPSYEGGFAVALPKVKDGKIISTGFFHFDFRGHKARWTYSS